MIDEIEKCMEQILLKIEPNLTSLTNRFSTRYRDDITQEARIKSWEFIRKKLEEDPKIAQEEILIQLREKLHIIVIFASKTMMRQINKFDKRFMDITDSDIMINDNHDMIDFTADFEHYRSFLSKKDFEILNYLFSVDESFSNFDNISRQLGYTGKGASKYRLLQIAQKILEFRSKN